MSTPNDTVSNNSKEQQPVSGKQRAGLRKAEKTCRPNPHSFAPMSLGRRISVFGAACVTIIPSFLAGVQGTTLMPLQEPTLQDGACNMTGLYVPGVAEEHLTYRYESHGRAFERKQMRWIAAARDSFLSFIFPTSILPPPNSTISVHYDPKAPALSIYRPALLQYNVLRAVFARAPVHPLQGMRLPDPPTDLKPP